MAMDVKKHFTRVFVIEGRIDKLNDKIETLRAKQTSGGGLGDGLGVQKSRNHGRLEDMSITILELEGELAKEKINLLTLETQIRAMSRGLQSPLERAIITWRYICRLKWKDIADRAEISEMQTIREHNAAIKKLEMDSICRLTNSIAN